MRVQISVLAKVARNVVADLVLCVSVQCTCVNVITFLLLRGSLEVKKACLCCVGRHVEVELLAGKVLVA